MEPRSAVESPVSGAEPAIHPNGVSGAEAPALAASPAKLERITVRSIVLGMSLVTFLSCFTPYSDNVIHNSYLVGNHLPFTIIFVITVLCTVVNPLLGARRLNFTEMVTALAMMFVAAAFPSSGFFRYFLPILASPVYYAAQTPWYHTFLNSLPNWMIASHDPASPIIQNYYLGIDPRSHSGIWWTVVAWARPYAAWSTFIFPLMILYILFCALMRKQWVVHERLAFPLARLPLDMLAAPEPGHRLNRLWRSRVLWVGALVPIFVHLVDGLATFNPSLPSIPLTYNISASLTDFPWNALSGSIKSATLYFSMVGVTFFVPLEIALSVWGFYVGYQLLMIFVQAQGAQISGEAVTSQSLGAVVAYGVLLLWVARHHFRHVLASVHKPREPQEFLSYRAMLVGMGVCIVICAGYLTVAFGGMDAASLPASLQNSFTGEVLVTFGGLLRPTNWALALGLIFLIVFFGMVLTRLVIEAGLLLIQFPANADPVHFLTLLLDHFPRLLSLRQWTVTSFASFFAFTDNRETLLPFAANALRMGSDIPFRQRRKFIVMLMVAVVAALLMSGTVHHVLTYEYGRQNFDDGAGPKWIPMGVMSTAHNAAEPTDAQVLRPAPFVYGAAAVTVVGAARLLWVGFPLHPIGLLMLNNWAIGQIWFSIMICWALKLAILRWGGPQVYERAKDFFIGLVVGDAIIGAVWVIVGLMVVWPNNLPYRLLPH